jgi:glycosyltransferase involved in cell wall biosynthesis
MSKARRLRILTWHVHGNYLWYLSHAPHQFFVPVQPDGRGALGTSFPWRDNMHEVTADEVRDTEFDCVLFQHHDNWLHDQHAILSPAQRRLPRVYLEHDPPRESPTDTVHPVDDPDVLLVHVTHFNQLFWDSGSTRTRVIEHGIVDPGPRYSGELARACVVVNEARRRGRVTGTDLLDSLSRAVPIDLYGIDASSLGGIEDLPHEQLLDEMARHRVYLHPNRWTSLGLSLIEAMHLGLPVVAVAATEVCEAVPREAGVVSTRVDALAEGARRLASDPDEARERGSAARAAALARYGLERFLREWDDALTEVTA